jgi:hypothetical protein
MKGSAVRAWFFLERGTRKGPVTQEVLTHHLRTVSDPASVLVWREGLERWVAAGDLAELRHDPSRGSRHPGSASRRTTSFLFAFGGLLLVMAALTFLWLRNRSLGSGTLPAVVRAQPVPEESPSILPPVTAPAYSPNLVADMDLQGLKFRGARISVDIVAGSLSDLGRLISDLTGVPTMVAPEADQTFTLKADNMPWDEVLYRTVVGTGCDYEMDRRSVRLRVFRRAGGNRAAVPLGQVLASMMVTGDHPVPAEYLPRLAGGVVGEATVHSGQRGSRVLMRNPIPWAVTRITYRRAGGVACEFVAMDGPILPQHTGFLRADGSECRYGELLDARGQPFGAVSLLPPD